MPAHFSGARVVLVARFNARYHRTGGALRAALASLGCEVAAVEERTRGLHSVLGRDLGSRLAAALKRHRADIVLVFKGAHLDPATIAALRPLSAARWVNWFPDGPHLLDLSLRIGAAYDWCFIFDSSMVARHRALGRRAEYLAEGFDPGYHRTMAVEKAASHRIAFVGSYEPLRAAALAAVSDLGLSARGPGWPRGPLYGDAFVRAFAEADVALNIHQFFGDSPEGERYGTGANRRVFELSGIGTVQLCDAKADIHRHFREGEEIVLFRTPQELRAAAIRLLADPEERACVAARARVRAVREHTWRHRLEELLTVACG